MAILLLTGPSATGKSTIAARLGSTFQIPVLGEREILRSLARSYGFARTRYWLAEVGIDTVLNEALAETVRVIAEKKNERGVILDGSYDRRLPQTLRQKFAGERVIIIAITAKDEAREEWITKRMGVTREEAREEMRLIDGFKYYAGMAEIIGQADLIIENNRSLDEAVREIHQLHLETELFSHPFGPERRRG